MRPAGNLHSLDDSEPDDEGLTLEEQWILVLAPYTPSYPIEDMIPEWNELDDDDGSCPEEDHTPGATS